MPIRLLIGAALLFAVAACSPARTTPDPETPPSANVERVQAKIGYIPIADHMLLGFSDIREGDTLKTVDIEPVRLPNYPTMTEALRSGSIDGAFILAPLAFQVRLSGSPVKLVLLGHRDGSGLVVSKAQGIKDVSALATKTVAIPHRFSTNNFLLHMYTNDGGLTGDREVKTIETAPPEMFSALGVRSIDAYITAEPFLSEAEAAGIGEVLVFTSQIWEQHPDCVLVLREDFIAANPEAVQELVSSLVRSAEFVEADRAGAVPIASEFLGKSTDIMANALTDRRRVTFNRLVPVISELDRMQDYMADNMGLFPEKVVMSEMVDASYAEIAYKAIGVDGGTVGE